MNTSRSVTTAQGVGSEMSFREEVKRTYQKRISVLVEQIEAIAREITKATKKEVLVVIDDLDKLDGKLVEDIYKNNINALFQPQIKIVFTIPIAVIRELELWTTLQTASGRPIQPMEVAKLFSRDDRHSPTAIPQKSPRQKTRGGLRVHLFR